MIVLGFSFNLWKTGPSMNKEDEPLTSFDLKILSFPNGKGGIRISKEKRESNIIN